MRGILFAVSGGAFITLQGVLNTLISQDIGVWQTATITQLTGFLVGIFVLIILRDFNWKNLRIVKPMYIMGGTFGAFIIFGNVTAFQYIGVTLAISALLISQLALTFLIDTNGWFGMVKQKVKLSQFIGIAMMIAGVLILKL